VPASDRTSIVAKPTVRREPIRRFFNTMSSLEKRIERLRNALRQVSTL
jgi:hypothetical protein